MRRCVSTLRSEATDRNYGAFESEESRCGDSRRRAGGPGLSGCSDEAKRGFLPATDTTDHTQAISSLWVNSWIVLLGVGIVVWGLTIWSIIAYRRRRGDRSVPAQTRYNLPIEVLYTTVPFILIIGFFVGTVNVQTATEAKATPAYDGADVQVQVVGKQWSWDINYLTDDGAADVHEDAGLQAQYYGGDTFDESDLPTLYLPVGQEVKIKLDSRDVAHSFWVPQFLYKRTYSRACTTTTGRSLLRRRARTR